MNAISKRLLSWLLVLVMVLSLVPALNLAVETKAAADGSFNQTEAAKNNANVMTEMAKNDIDVSDEAFFGEGGYFQTNTCPMCDREVKWGRVISGRLEGVGYDTEHYYYADANGVAPAEAVGYSMAQMVYGNKTGKAICVFIPEKVTITTTSLPFYTETSNYNISVMGKGTIKAGSATEISGTNNAANFYGITLQWNTAAAARLLTVGGTSNTVNIYGNTVIGQPAAQTATSQSLVSVTSATGTVNMYGGTIQNGYATHDTYRGGNVMLTNGTFNMYGGAITGGKTTVNGGNVAVQGGGKFNMYGGAISNGEATTARGGNIFVNATSTTPLNVQGGTISGGKAKTQGGNIMIYAGADCAIGGTALITGGVAQTQGGNICTFVNLKLSGGTVSDGLAYTNGGNIYNSAAATLTIDGATVAKGCTTGGALDAGSGKYPITNSNKGSYWGANIAAQGDIVVDSGLIYGGYHPNDVIQRDRNISAMKNLTINGGTIVGDVKMETGGAMVLTGSPVITMSYTLEDTTKVSGWSGLNMNSGNIKANIEGLDADASIVLSYLSLGQVFTATSPNAANVADCFTVDVDGLAAAVNGNNELEVVEAVVIAKIGNVEYTSVNALVNAYQEGDVILLQVSEITLPDNDQTVYLLNAPNWNRYTIHGNVKIGIVGAGEYKLDAGVQPEPAAYNPTSGQQIVSVCDSATNNVWLGYHYDVKLTHVTLRATTNPGLYYKSEYKIPATYSRKWVKEYGVVASVHADADLSNEFAANANGKTKWTVCNYDAAANDLQFQATGGSVVNIFKDDRSAAANAACLNKQIYVNAYLAIDRTPADPDDEYYYVMADMDNRSDARQEPISYSLFDAVKAINDNQALIDSLKVNQPTAYENLQKMAAKWCDADLGEATATWENITSNILADYNQ